MTPEQIEKYEYCKNHLTFISESKKLMPFKFQKYGCSSNCPSIENQLENIHRKMYEKINDAIAEASTKVNDIIDSI